MWKRHAWNIFGGLVMVSVAMLLCLAILTRTPRVTVTAKQETVAAQPARVDAAVESIPAGAVSRIIRIPKHRVTCFEFATSAHVECLPDYQLGWETNAK